MKEEKRNIGASVTARLLNLAKQTGDDYQTLLANFCFERFLYRLSRSEIKDRFVLKGATLLRVWSDQPYRATRDLDFLRRGNGSFEAIRRDIALVCETPVEPDGVEFDPEAIQLERIRAEDEYAGTRATIQARCGTARLTLQIDMGLGDSVWPPPKPTPYPVLLEFPAPEVFAFHGKRWSLRSSKRWWCSATGIAGSKTSSTFTIWPRTSSSTGPHCQRQ